MTDERRDSLAAQAASWVPPWERAPREPDRVDQAAATGPDFSDDLDEDFEQADPSYSSPTGMASDPSSAATDGEVPDELGPLPGEAPGAAIVDSPADLPEEADSPTDVGIGPDLAEPAAVEDAVEDAAEDELGELVDAPLPSDGDDAGACSTPQPMTR